MIFKVRYMTAPTIPHVYVRVFVSPAPGETFANIGTLRMRKPEFEQFQKCFKAEFVADEMTSAL